MKQKATHRSSDPYLVLFEDAAVHELAPLASLHPVFDIKTGARTLREKFAHSFGSPVDQTYVRQYLTMGGGHSEDDPDDKPDQFIKPVLFVNGSVICDSNFVKQCKGLALNTALVSQNRILAMFLNPENAAKHAVYLREQLADVEYSSDIEFFPCNARMLRHSWDVIRFHDEELASDMRVLLKSQRKQTTSFRGTTFLKSGDIRIGKNSRIYPSVILNAEKGPIVIGNNCTIFPHSYIEGPCAIGDFTIIRPQTNLQNSAIGVHCKIGGEITSSVFHGFINKQHEGFAGNSYFAPWVNIGAGTITSNLKNNYSTVHVGEGTKRHDSGLQFFGTIAGDHVKFGINTMLNTGTVVGIGCNIFGGNFPPKDIPAFQWGGAQGFVRFDLEKLLAVIRTAMARRSETLSPDAERIIRTVYAEKKTTRKKIAD